MDTTMQDNNTWHVDSLIRKVWDQCPFNFQIEYYNYTPHEMGVKVWIKGVRISEGPLHCLQQCREGRGVLFLTSMGLLSLPPSSELVM